MSFSPALFSTHIMELYDHLASSFSHQTLAVVLPYHTFDQWFFPWDSLPPRGHLVKSGDVFGCLTGGCYWHLGVKAVQFSSVQSLSCVRLFATPWTAARQASLSIGTTSHPTVVKTAPNNHGWHLTPVSAVGGQHTLPLGQPQHCTVLKQVWFPAESLPNLDAM